MNMHIWTWLHLTEEGLDEADLGLIAEARRLADEAGSGRVTTVAVGEDTEGRLPRLGDYGADGVIHLWSDHLIRYNGEAFTRALVPVVKRQQPAVMLFAHRPPTADLAARLGAVLGWPVITRGVDVHGDDPDSLRVVRPVAEGYLFETVTAPGSSSTIVTFLPDGMADPKPAAGPVLDLDVIIPELDTEALDLQSVEIIEADPQTLALEEADIVVAAGRGACQAGTFAALHRVARALKASLGGTRPVIDDHLMPYERQIGQTGKTVMPRLIVNCGISGANEYTAGMEKSQWVIAVNTDTRARIFRFADLGIVGDAGTVLPLLAEQLEKSMAQQK